MAAAETLRSNGPLALVVHQDDEAAHVTSLALRARGYRTFVVEVACSDHETIARLEADLLVLVVKNDLLSLARLLVELARTGDAPPSLLVADDPDATWVAARFGIFAARPNEREIAWAVERTQREARRPSVPT